MVLIRDGSIGLPSKKKSDRWIDHTFDGWLRPKGCTKKELPETPPSLRPEGFKYRYLEVDSLQRYHIINLPHLNQLRVSPSDIPMGASKKSSIRTSGDKAKLVYQWQYLSQSLTHKRRSDHSRQSWTFSVTKNSSGVRRRSRGFISLRRTEMI